MNEMNIASFESSDSSSGDETDRSSYIYHRHVEEKKNWDKFVSTVPEAGSASENRLAEAAGEIEPLAQAPKMNMGAGKLLTLLPFTGDL